MENTTRSMSSVENRSLEYDSVFFFFFKPVYKASRPREINDLLLTAEMFLVCDLQSFSLHKYTTSLSLIGCQNECIVLIWQMCHDKNFNM